MTTASPSAEAKVAPLEAAPDLHNPRLYINRELSLLSFQRRVLEEAEDETNPLLERAKFLSIVGSNLDEFFMVRVAGLTAQVDAGIPEVGADRMSPGAQLVAIRREVKRLMADAHRCLRSDLLPALEKAGIEILEYSDLNPRQINACDRYFAQTIFPVLTPLAFDPGRPFPHISNLSLNLAVLICDSRGVEHFARIKVPDTLPQLVPVTRPRKKAGKRIAGKEGFVWIEQVIAANLAALFPGMQVLEAHPFHVTRDADIAIKELEAEDLLETIEEGVRQRRFGSVVRLKVNQQMPAHILRILINNLEVDSNQVYRVKGLLGLSRLMTLHQIERPDLKFKPFVPAVPPSLAHAGDDEDIFTVVRRGDVLLHHPFDSFQPVVDFLRKAARDPDVLAIKIVLYRVGRNSPVVETLLEAIENGKQVAVLMELKARFDEESNIEWAKALEGAGVHVVYGLVGLKIHCKVAMVVRRESDTIRRYIHMATGNYNAVTAHLYTDMGMLTVREDIGSDATDLFNYLTGYSAKRDYQKLLVAPVNMRERFEAKIEREIRHQLAGKRGHLIFKMNSLVDPQVIRMLYRASQAGVKVDLLVRGICCLRPGIAGVSDNIQVTSIVGRFLEHTRVYYLRNGGQEEVYLGSADLMPRNINRRVEALFPVEDETLLRRIKDEILETYLADNVKARRMASDGTYKRLKAGDSKKAVDAQAALLPKEERRARKGNGK
ncbi:MAG TPA: polyphosphate kinase 1 [Bryobacteraceae bacterium]|nr:polyphosphate kinase 1 [Bryobacteraceae bacterium]